MKKYLNTLFITRQGTYLSKEGETIAINIDHKTVSRIPALSINGIICFGNISVSPFLMGYCAENNISLSFLSEHGKFLANVIGKKNGNVLLRRSQYRVADDPDFSLKISKGMIIAKIYNCRTVLNRALRDHSEKINSEKIEEASEYLKYHALKADKSLNMQELRGIEGDCAKTYFSVFDELILAQKDTFNFKGRTRRPPLDNVNCLLSYLYTLLMYDVRSALESVGLDSYVGFFHTDRPGRASLALDMMEEWRPVIADRLALSLINREQLNSRDFRKTESGAVILSDEGRRTLLESYQKRKTDEISHPYLKETIPVGLLFYTQALLLARFLRGDIDGYPAFLWK